MFRLVFCILLVTGCSTDEQSIEDKTLSGETTEAVLERPMDVIQNTSEIVVSRVYPQTEELDCLALNIYFESRGDSYAGRVSVADVVLNRVDSRYYPNTICEVVKQSVHSRWWKERGKEVPVRHQCQFSWYCDGLDDTPNDPHAWEDAQSIARNILTNDTFRGITEGSTHYHTLAISPNWINDRGMRYVGIIGAHKFYRWH